MFDEYFIAKTRKDADRFKDFILDLEKVFKSYDDLGLGADFGPDGESWTTVDKLFGPKPLFIEPPVIEDLADRIRKGERIIGYMGTKS